MSRTRTKAELRADVRKRADLESHTTVVPDTEIDRYVEQGKAAYHEVVVMARGESYFPFVATANTTSNTSTISLSLFQYTNDVGATSNVTNFLRELAVRVTVNGAVRDLTPYNRNERGRFLDSNVGWQGYPSHYGIEREKLQLLPTPSGVFPVVLEFIPCVEAFANDNSTFDGVNGWEEYVVDWAALKCASKTRNTELKLELIDSVAAAAARITTIASVRLGQPSRMTDVRRRRVRYL